MITYLPFLNDHLKLGFVNKPIIFNYLWPCLLCTQNGEKFETFHQVMDISNQTSMPISIVKETPGSVLVKMDLKSYQPNYYITLEPKSVFVGIGDESKGILTLKTGAYSSIQNIIPGELTINLDFSVRQTVERMV